MFTRTNTNKLYIYVTFYKIHPYLNIHAQANLQARDVIFKHHNEGKGPLFLDLHGLYVREALHFLGIRLDIDLFRIYLW